jgi:hypothetical protein
MNAMRCRYENEMIRALGAGALSESLMEHQKGCADCRDAIVVAQALRRDAGDLAARLSPPRSAQVWAAAERHRRMAALERATRFVFALKIAGLIYAAVLVLWGVRTLAVRAVMLPGLNAGSLNATITGAGLAVLFVGGGLWYALRRDERLPY